MADIASTPTISTAPLIDELVLAHPHENPGLFGDPGIGKTACLDEVARRRGMSGTEVVPVSTLHPASVAGLPDISEVASNLYETRHHHQSFMVRNSKQYEQMLMEQDPEAGPIEKILVLDDFTEADPDVMSMLYGLLDSRRVGTGCELADGVMLVLTGNRSRHRGFAINLPTPILSRISQYEVVPSLNDWAPWARASGIDPLILAFLHQNERLFNQFDADQAWDRQSGWPCPRTWERLSKFVLRRRREQGRDLRTDLGWRAAGIIGPHAAMVFSTWLKTAADAPTPDDIIADPAAALRFIEKDPTAHTLALIENLLAALHRDPEGYMDGAITFVRELHMDVRARFVNELVGLYGSTPPEVIDAGLARLDDLRDLRSDRGMAS